MSENNLGGPGALPRVTPESVGVPAGAVEALIYDLERVTEPHSLMIAREGKVLAEAWWRPYSPVVKHMLASHSKGYSATAIGILVTQGKLSVDDLVCELLPEYMPEELPENLKKLRVRHLLTMTSGMTTLPNIAAPEWEKAFFRCEFTHEPGTVFFYSGNFTAMLCVIVRKVAGCGVKEFLTKELFSKIGIDPDTIKWMTHYDGLEYGGGGMITITENNLRLGQLYLNGGVWNGERILSEQWVEDALAVQYEFHGSHSHDIGYGYQTWTAEPYGSPRFDGAGGQYTIMCREQNLVVSITESGPMNVNDVVLPVVERFCDKLSDEPLPANTEAEERLAKCIARLAVPGKLPVRPVSPRASELCGKVWKLEENRLALLPEVWGSLTALMRYGLDDLAFGPTENGAMELCFTYGGEPQRVQVSFDGLPRYSPLVIHPELPGFLYAEGAWEAEDTLQLRLHVVEAAANVDLTLTLADGGIVLSRRRFDFFQRKMVLEEIHSL